MKVRWKFVLALALAIVIGPCAVMSIAGGAQKLYASFVDFTEGTAYTAPSGHSGISFDSGTHKMKASLNGGAPAIVPTKGGGDVDLGSSDITGTAAVGHGGTGLTAGTSGGVPYFNSTSTMLSSGALTANQLVIGGGAGAAPAALGSLGTTTTVLHGNAAGASTYGAIVNADITNSTIDLTAKVTGDLPFSNLAQGTARSVLGVTGASTADVASIASSSDGDFVYREGGAVSFATLQSITASVPTLTGGAIFGYESGGGRNYRVLTSYMAGLFNNGTCEGRLTLTTAVPVTTADVTSSSHLYFTPYTGSRIALYDGSAGWKMYTFSEIDTTLSGLNPGGIYDVFAYDSGGNVTIETVAWTDTNGLVNSTSVYIAAPDNRYQIGATTHGLSIGDTVWVYGTGGSTGINDKAYTVATVADANHFEVYYGGTTPGVWSSNGTWRKTNVARVTALAYQDGVLVKSGTTTKRYLGTFMATSSSTTRDSAQHRYVWNAQNRVRRKMMRQESIDSWAYTTAGFRLSGGSFDNMVDCIVGYFGTASIQVNGMAYSSNTNAGIARYSGIGVNTAVANSGDLIAVTNPSETTFQTSGNFMVNYNATTPTLSTGTGHFIFNWLEYSQATGTTTWYGDAGGATLQQSGLSGSSEN